MDEAGSTARTPGNPDLRPWRKSGEPPLHAAARQGNHDEIRRLVSEGAPVDEIFDVAFDPEARAFPGTPLMQAVASDDGASTETVQVLLDLGASIEPPFLESIISCAVGGLGWDFPRGGDAARLQMVIEAASDRGLGIPSTEGTGERAFFLVAGAAETGDPERVRVLIGAGLDPDPEGATTEWQWPLYQAVASGSVATVQVLLDAGADPNKRLGRSCDPLLACARSPEMLGVLLDAGVVVEQQRAEKVLASIATADPPMSSAGSVTVPSVPDRVSMVRRVVEARSISPEQLFRALRDVVFRAEASGVEVLLAAGADPHRHPRLLHAVCFGVQYDEDDWDAERVVRLLIDAGLDPDDQDERGFRPLLAAMSPDTFGPDYQESDGYNGSAALGLIRGGAQVDLVYPDTDIPQLEPPEVAGWTPLHVAAHYTDAPVVDALLEAGADPLTRTPQGQTPLELAQARLTSLAALRHRESVDERFFREAEHVVALLTPSQTHR